MNLFSLRWCEHVCLLLFFIIQPSCIPPISPSTQRPNTESSASPEPWRWDAHTVKTHRVKLWAQLSSSASRVVAGRVHSGQLRRSHQRSVSRLRQHAAAKLSGARGQHGQVRQVQGRFQNLHEEVWSFTVSSATLLRAGDSVWMLWAEVRCSLTEKTWKWFTFHTQFLHINHPRKTFSVTS